MRAPRPRARPAWRRRGARGIDRVQPLAEVEDHREGVVDGIRVGDEDIEPGRAQGIDILAAVLLAVRDDEVRAGGDDAVDVRVLRAAEDGDGFDSARGFGAEARAPDKRIARAEPPNEFGEARHERDDALRARHCPSVDAVAG